MSKEPPSGRDPLAGFSEEDKKKLIEFLNLIAKHANFNFSTVEAIDYVKLLTHLQQKLLPKIEQHILEVKRVVQAEPKKAKAKKTS